MKLPSWMEHGHFISPTAEKYVLTVCLCFLNIGWGTIVVIPGPTLMDLQRLIGHDPSMMNWVFFARTIGYLISAPLGGLTARYSLQMSVVVSAVLIAVTALAIPWCPVIWQMTTVFGIHGLALGIFDIVTTVLLIKTWEEHKAPFIQTFNVIGYMGSLIAPTLARPFISEQEPVTFHTNMTTSHPNRGPHVQKGQHYGLPMWHTDYTKGRPALETEDTSNLKGLFAILAAYELVMAFIFYLFAIYFKGLEKYDQYTSEPDLKKVTSPAFRSKTDNGINGGYSFVFSIIFLSTSMQFLSGGEVALSVGSYGAEYIMHYHKGTIDDATLAETTFAASMVVCGIISVVLLKFIRADIIIKLNVFFQGVGALFFLGGALNFVILCIGLAIVAAALSSFTASNICWATDRVGRPALVASVVALGYPLGEMLFPLIIGLNFIRDPNSLIFCMFGNAMVLLFIYTLGEIISTSAKLGKFNGITLELDNLFERLHWKIAESDCCIDSASDDSDDRAILVESPEQPQPSVSGYLVQPRSDARSRLPFDADHGD